GAWAGYLCFVAAMTSPPLRVIFFANPSFLATFPIHLAGWMVCDYISLRVIRTYLNKSERLIWSMMMAFLIGICIISLSFVIIEFMSFVGLPAVIYGVKVPYFVIYDFPIFIALRFLYNPYGIFRLIEPALWVHIWLLLFALGAVGYRLIYWFFQ